MFKRVAGLVERFRGNINYYSGWNVEGVSLENQVFMTLMKVRQDYTYLHLAEIFCCSTATVSNVVTTMVHLLHTLLHKTIMASVPSRQKNQRSLPQSFVPCASNCRMIVDCTDIPVEEPSEMDKAKKTYSSYRSRHTFKVLISVAPNGVINFCSRLFPGSVSDKTIVLQSGIRDVLVSVDLVLADKGFFRHPAQGSHCQYPTIPKQRKVYGE